MIWIIGAEFADGVCYLVDVGEAKTWSTDPREAAERLSFQDGDTARAYVDAAFSMAERERLALGVYTEVGK